MSEEKEKIACFMSTLCSLIICHAQLMFMTFCIFFLLRLLRVLCSPRAAVWRIMKIFCRCRDNRRIYDCSSTTLHVVDCCLTYSYSCIVNTTRTASIELWQHIKLPKYCNELHNITLYGSTVEWSDHSANDS